MSLAETATLLEDAIDIHDRHWKIHWMLNFAQLSATLDLRAVMQKVRGSIDEELLGRLQNSASDRNWDSIESLWRMKNEVRDDPDLRAAFGVEATEDIATALRGTERGRRFIAERIEPYQREFGWHAVWSHEFIFPTVREQMEPVLELIRGYLVTDYDYPSAIEAMRGDIAAASEEILAGLSGEALEEMRAANAINLRMAPLTPDHHFYIDQGANAAPAPGAARGRARSSWRRAASTSLTMCCSSATTSCVPSSATPARSTRAGSWRRGEREREAAERVHPRDWIGTVTPSQLAFPYLVNWGYPERFERTKGEDELVITGIAGSPGVIEGTARVVKTVDEFDDVREGDILVCQMTNPAWVVLFTKIAGLVTDTGGTTSHPAVLSREFGIPAVVGTSEATRRIATGDRIRVDGTAGRVEILRRAGPDRRGTPPGRLARAPLADQVKDRLLDGILSGHYPPDTRIVETQVARELGTSQAPVREALRGLEALGVVEITPFRGARVRRPTRREILEAYVVRSTLESLAARLAVPRLTDQDLGELSAELEAMRAAARDGDGHGVAEADARVPRPDRGARRERDTREGLAHARAVLADVLDARGPGGRPALVGRAPRPDHGGAGAAGR